MESGSTPVFYVDVMSAITSEKVSVMSTGKRMTELNDHSQAFQLKKSS